MCRVFWADVETLQVALKLGLHVSLGNVRTFFKHLKDLSHPQ